MSSKELMLQLVETPGPALFWRDWLAQIQLKWGEIKARMATGAIRHKVGQWLQKFASVFSEGVRTLQGHRAYLKVKENCQPSFQKPRQVPYALRPKVEAKLTHLQRKTVSCLKQDTMTRLSQLSRQLSEVGQCDCVSVYPVLLAEQHSLPRTEDIFRNLAGEKHFSKLDLRQAYHQLEVTEESNNNLTITTHKGLFKYKRLVFDITSNPPIWKSAIDLAPSPSSMI